MKKFGTKVYIVYIILFASIFIVFAIAYNLMAKRYISNTASETILRMDEQVGVTVDQMINRDFLRFEDLINDIEKTNTDLEDKYNALKDRKSELNIYASSFEVGAIRQDDKIYYYELNDGSHSTISGVMNSSYYSNKVAIYRLPDVIGASSTDNTNLIFFRFHDLIIYFNADDYLSVILNNVSGMPENYYLIVEDNCGIAYEKNINETATSLINGYVSEQNCMDLAEEFAKDEGGYKVIGFNGKSSLFVFTPILNDYSNSVFNLVYVVEEKIALKSASYLTTSLIMTGITVFILINIGMFACVVFYIRKEEDLSNNRLRFFFSKPFVISLSKKGSIKSINKTANDHILNAKKYKNIYDFKFYELDTDVMQMIRTQKTFTIETKDKEDNKLYIRIIPLKVFGGYALLGEDVTLPLHESNKNAKIALYNPVTNLPNRYLLEDALNEMLASPKLGSSNHALVAIDVIDFAKINKMFGFSAGDKLLNEVARILKQGTEKFHVVVYNIRTSIFNVLFYDIKSFQEIIDWNKEITVELSKPINIKDNFSTVVDFKIGMYNIDGSKVSGLTANNIYDNAASALDRAKNSRLLKSAIYNSEFSQMLSRDQIMEQDLFTAVKNREFTMLYQPQYNTKLGKIVGFEALVRWDNPKYRFETVENYIKMAERNGLIIDIGRIIIEKTFEFAKKIENTGIHISMNVSAAQLLHSGFINELIAYHEEYKIKEHMISIEITETFLMENSEVMIDKLKILRDKGFGIHLDDFGIGYSSMLYLKDLPVDTIKIDKEFTKGAVTDKFSRSIVTRLVQLALGLDLNLVAEGVENEKQMNFLSHIGCDVIQGYLISKPVDEAQTLALIKKYNGTYVLSDADINEQLANANEEGDDFVRPIVQRKKKEKKKKGLGLKEDNE